jgi:hypothetical protein
MRRIIIFIFIIVFLASACATTPRALPEKYNLDNDLEAVDQISIFKVSDYENVDYQSIILEADWNKYYLLVLRRPIDMKYSNLRIDIESTASKDEAVSTEKIIGDDFHQAPSNIASIVSGYDRIVVEEPAGKWYYVIDKIYKLKGMEQAEEIKERLRKN